ncbi:MAG: xanthine dehydrogenase molybdopterin binding subunit, partial [Alphaproteobacteria bacterium]
DDIPELPGTLQVFLATSIQAHATIEAMDLTAVRSAPGVVAVLTVDDIPGVNDYSPALGDDPIFAKGLAEYAGQPLFAVAAPTIAQARAAAGLAHISYIDRPANITIDEALAADADLMPAHTMRLGDADAALAAARHRLAGSVSVGGQDHFYLEGHVAYAIPGEGDDLLVYSSTQHPSEVQQNIARALAIADHNVTVEIRRMGGGFGGKESQPSLLASVAALVVRKTGRPSKVCFDRDDDMVITGKRHEFQIGYDVGFDGSGRLAGIAFEQAARCGYSADVSLGICDRAMFHADNAYDLASATIHSRRLKTNTVSNTAFRGFGGPQGMVGIERVMDKVAFATGRDPLDVRRVNFYGPEKAPDKNNVTPYHQTVTDSVIGEIVDALEASSDYRARRAQITAFNRANSVLKKGIALTPVKFGISFTLTHLNQAGALVHIYKDGSVHLNHGGTEMGQGLFIKIAQIVAEEFQIDVDNVKITATTTAKVPNTSATAASSGSDLNGMAARIAARSIKDRVITFAADHYRVPPDQVIFLPNRVRIGNDEIPFAQLIGEAYQARISLSSTGFYSTPTIYYDRETARGHPFFYFAYGAAVSEVVIDTLTGEYKVLRTDILHDCGKSLNPAIDMGQIEGGFIQGMGWLTTEELWWDDKGVLKTHAPSTYKIPTASDRPQIMNMAIWEPGENKAETIYQSKAVGEPPLMMAISVFSALTDAVLAAGEGKTIPQRNAPATPEAVLRAVEAVQ